MGKPYASIVNEYTFPVPTPKRRDWAGILKKSREDYGSRFIKKPFSHLSRELCVGADRDRIGGMDQGTDARCSIRVGSHNGCDEYRQVVGGMALKKLSKVLLVRTALIIGLASTGLCIGFIGFDTNQFYAVVMLLVVGLP